MPRHFKVWRETFKQARMSGSTTAHPCLVQHICAHGDEVVDFFVSFCFRCELGFLNCDNICMCVLNKQFELPKFVLNSVYVDLKYNVISLTFTAGSSLICLWGCLGTLCGCGGCGNCDVSTVVCVEAERVWWCEGDGNVGVWDRGGVVGMSAGHEYVGGKRGSGIVSSAADVLGWVWCVGWKELVECVKCACVWLGRCRRWGCAGRVSVFGLRRCGWCGLCRWGVSSGLRQGSGRIGWCYVCVSCEPRFFM